VTLLCLSSGGLVGWWVLEEAPDASGDVALQAADDFGFGFALGEAAGDVLACGRVLSESCCCDDVEGVVEAAVAATVESVPVLRLA